MREAEIALETLQRERFERALPCSPMTKQGTKNVERNSNDHRSNHNRRQNPLLAVYSVHAVNLDVIA